jgi:hypothetical protein
MTLVLIGAAVGLVLGLRYKVFVLIPVICIAFAIVALKAVAHGDGFGRTALMVFAVVTSLQLGYVLGNALAYVAVRLAAHRDLRRDMEPASNRGTWVGDEGDARLDPDRSNCLPTPH